MDWLIDSRDVQAGPGQALTLVEEHLLRHAVDRADVTAARDALADDLRHAFMAAEGRPLHLSLSWAPPTPVLTATLVEAAVGDERPEVPTGRPVPARLRAAVRSWPQVQATRTDLPIQRRSHRTFDAGPPPVVGSGIDPDRQGPAAVAVALLAAMEAHPSASPVQAAAIAGALIADAGAGDQEVPNGRAAADAFVRLHRALGAEAHVVSADDQVVELAVSACPFGDAGSHTTSLCHVSSGLAGQLAARVNGAATVVLDETIASGDLECHLQVLLGETAAEQPDGQPFFWPPRAAPVSETVPQLDLSVSLPRESVSVPVVRRLAAQALRAFGVHDADVEDVELAITEACANVIDHAGATDTYDVKVELASERCAITVVDQGGGFDAASVPDRPHEEAERGRGLTLMRALVDNVAFRNEPRAGAVVHMVKVLHYDTSHPLRKP